MNSQFIASIYFLLISFIFFVSGVAYNVGYRQNTRDLIKDAKNITIERFTNGDVKINEFIRKDN